MRSPDLDGRHSGLKKAAAALVPMMIHEPELHGRHGGLKAWAGDLIIVVQEPSAGWPSLWPEGGGSKCMWTEPHRMAAMAA